jgi:predicted nucleic acid-binding protein
MKLLIDTNVFHIIFDKTHKEFAEYEPAHICLLYRKGAMSYGGTKFLEEIKPYVKKYGRLFNELKRKGKLIELNKGQVDSETKRIKDVESDPDFDDPHLIACVIAGKLSIVCTNDKRADRFILNKKFYPKGISKPKVYRNKQNAHLFNKCFP